VVPVVDRSVPIVPVVPVVDRSVPIVPVVPVVEVSVVDVPGLVAVVVEVSCCVLDCWVCVSWARTRPDAPTASAALMARYSFVDLLRISILLSGRNVRSPNKYF
jgi:hypothetical protein